MICLLFYNWKFTWTCMCSVEKNSTGSHIPIAYKYLRFEIWQKTFELYIYSWNLLYWPFSLPVAHNWNPNKNQFLCWEFVFDVSLHVTIAQLFSACQKVRGILFLWEVDLRRQILKKKWVLLFWQNKSFVNFPSAKASLKWLGKCRTTSFYNIMFCRYKKMIGNWCVFIKIQY